MYKDKDRAYSDFKSMITDSWTWDRLTDEERKTFENHLACWSCSVGGSYDTRYGIFNLLYQAYLAGVGYNGFTWREPPKVFALIYENGDEVCRFEKYEHALNKANSMWENSNIVTSIVKVDNEVPKF